MIVSEKSIVLTFSHTKAYEIVKRSRLTECHHLNKLVSTWAPNAAYQVPKSSAFWFQRRRFSFIFLFWFIFFLFLFLFFVFYYICAWRPSWSCGLDHLKKLSFSIPRRLHMKFGYNPLKAYWGKEVWHYWIDWLGPRQTNDLDLWYS